MKKKQLDLPFGWLSRDEVKDVQRHAAGARLAVELGAWMGRSTTVLAGVAEYVISIDAHKGIHGRDEDSLPEYLDAVRKLPNVAMVIARFQDFVPFLAGSPVDYVFIDGDHDYDSVERDVLLALLLDPAKIALHDWDFDPVKAAATMILGEPDYWKESAIATYVRREW